MNSDNSVCQFYLRNICRFGDECLKRHEKPSCSKHELSVRTCEIAASSYQLQEGHSNVQQELTDEPTTYDAAFNPAKDVNGIHPEKWTNKPTNQDLTNLKLENKKLVKQINLLETTVNILCKKLKQQEKEKARLNDEFHTMRLNDEDYKCRICLEVFIKPILTNCSHMFCEYCIDIWLSKSDKCPTCHVIMDDYSYCLNMGNFIKRMMEQMPEKVKMNFKKLEDTRSKYKPKSKLLNIMC